MGSAAAFHKARRRSCAWRGETPASLRSGASGRPGGAAARLPAPQQVGVTVSGYRVCPGAPTADATGAVCRYTGVHCLANGRFCQPFWSRKLTGRLLIVQGCIEGFGKRWMTCWLPPIASGGERYRHRSTSLSPAALFRPRPQSGGSVPASRPSTEQRVQFRVWPSSERQPPPGRGRFASARARRPPARTNTFMAGRRAAPDGRDPDQASAGGRGRPAPAAAAARTFPARSRRARAHARCAAFPGCRWIGGAADHSGPDW